MERILIENSDLRTRLLVAESLEFLRSGAYEFQIPGVKTPSGRMWYQRTDGSQFALMNMKTHPQLVCRFDVERIDTFIPKLPEAMRVYTWVDRAAEPECPDGTQAAFMSWMLRTEVIAVTHRDDLDYWQLMASQLQNFGAVLILFDRISKPYLREIDDAQTFREELEVNQFTRTGLIGNLDQLEAALC